MARQWFDRSNNCKRKVYLKTKLAFVFQKVDLIVFETNQLNLTLNGMYSFPAWRSAFMGDCGEQAGKFVC